MAQKVKQLYVCKFRMYTLLVALFDEGGTVIIRWRFSVEGA